VHRASRDSTFCVASLQRRGVWLGKVLRNASGWRYPGDIPRFLAALRGRRLPRMFPAKSGAPSVKSVQSVHVPGVHGARRAWCPACMVPRRAWCPGVHGACQLPACMRARRAARRALAEAWMLKKHLLRLLHRVYGEELCRSMEWGGKRVSTFCVASLQSLCKKSLQSLCKVSAKSLQRRGVWLGKALRHASGWRYPPPCENKATSRAPPQAFSCETRNAEMPPGCFRRL